MLTDLQRTLCNRTTWWTITKPSLIVDAFLILKLDLPKPVLFFNLASDLQSLSRAETRTSEEWFNYFTRFYDHYCLQTLRYMFDHPPSTRRSHGLRQCLSPPEIIRRLPVVRKIVEENSHIPHADRVTTWRMTFADHSVDWNSLFNSPNLIASSH